MAYADSSAKQVGGWWQAGYGVYFAQGSPRDFMAPVPLHERQSLSQGELWGMLHALEIRQPQERLVIVLDSEYGYKGIMEWSPKWKRH